MVDREKTDEIQCWAVVDICEETIYSENTPDLLNCGCFIFTSDLEREASTVKEGGQLGVRVCTLLDLTTCPGWLDSKSCVFTKISYTLSYNKSHTRDFFIERVQVKAKTLFIYFLKNSVKLLKNLYNL